MVNLNFKFWFVSVEILAVVSDAKACARRLFFQNVRQTQIAKLKMMTIGLAIRRHVH